MQAALAVGLVAVLVLLSHACGISLCPVKRLFGLPCPTCGATRALLLAARGDVAAAFALQPLVMVLAALAGPVALAAFAFRSFRMFVAAVLGSPWTWGVLSATVLANWAYVIMNGN